MRSIAVAELDTPQTTQHKGYSRTTMFVEWERGGHAGVSIFPTLDLPCMPNHAMTPQLSCARDSSFFSLRRGPMKHSQHCVFLSLSVVFLQTPKPHRTLLPVHRVVVHSATRNEFMGNICVDQRTVRLACVRAIRTALAEQNG